MSGNRTTFKSWAFAFLCFYACCYPICALLFLNQGSENVGSLALQAFQGASVIALFFFWKISSASRVLNLWICGIVYFACIALYMAVFRAFDERFVEITYALRFIFWFLFAFAIEQDCFSSKRTQTLVYCFAIGATIQSCVAIACYLFNLGGGSIYSDINASAGSKYVSGKTVVVFIALEIVLVCYWLFKSKKNRALYFLMLLSGASAILFSFNRSVQLGLFLAALWSLTWLVRHNRLKILMAFFCVIAVATAFFVSLKGDEFLKRWDQIEKDRGSGRVEILDVAANNVLKPKSPEALFIGRGYHKTKNLMFGVFGIRIGTHSDLLDFLTAYGLAGLVFYLLIIRKFFLFSRRTPPDSLERLCCRASTIVLIVMSLVTGVFQGTYAVLMFLFVSRYYQNEAKEANEARIKKKGALNAPSSPFRVLPNPPQAFAPTSQFMPVALKSYGVPSTVDDEEKRFDALDFDDAAPTFVETEQIELESLESKPIDQEQLEAEPGNENADADKTPEESQPATEKQELDEGTLNWLQGLDSLYGELDKINDMFAKNAKQKQ